MNLTQKLKRKYREMTTTISALNILIVLSFVMFCYSIFRMVYIIPRDETERLYYTINYDNNEYQLIEGFSSPIINSRQLENYVNRIVMTIYNYDALNYQEHYRDVVSTLFKKEAWQPFVEKVYPRLEIIKQSGVSVSSVPLSNVQINRFGYVGKDFIFEVSLPIKITYSSKQGNYNEDTLIRLSLLRVPTSTHITGLQILSLKESKFDLSEVYKVPEIN